LFHGYAKLYVGVFDEDEGRDEFVGRVVVDLARLRPRSSYDVTMPLRLSAQVYSRRPRGSIRLRFTLRWNRERDCVLSYLPKKVRFTPPQRSKPNLDVTVKCADQKAFHNIAITVHGAHLPGKFTPGKLKAAIREINFTRKWVLLSLRMWFNETRRWKHPLTSAGIFMAWMHLVYLNSFSLVPAYFVSFAILFIMRNYTKYGTDHPSQNGFTPPTVGEVFWALVRGGSTSYNAIQPLELNTSSERSHPTILETSGPLCKEFIK